jgi:hypothetical protein
MRSFAKHRWWLLTALLTVPMLAVAAGVPNVFKAGDVISSGQVNDNFQSLADRVAALEAAAAQGNPWVMAGDNTSKAVWDSLVAKYPPDHYEWGVKYNDIAGQIHRVTFSKWNRGIRIVTEEYMEGDGNETDPSGNFWMGGSVWFYDTLGGFDDACTAAGSFKHLYWQRSASGTTLLPGNGCNGGTWFVRRR